MKKLILLTLTVMSILSCNSTKTKIIKNDSLFYDPLLLTDTVCALRSINKGIGIFEPYKKLKNKCPVLYIHDTIYLLDNDILHPDSTGQKVIDSLIRKQFLTNENAR